MQNQRCLLGKACMFPLRQIVGPTELYNTGQSNSESSAHNVIIQRWRMYLSRKARLEINIESRF
jgi:hypothetical protein